MRRLNVQSSQIEECIRRSMFAISQRPTIEPGELMLLQLTKQDAQREGKLDRRVEYVLEFDHAEADPDGRISRAHWPDADRTWPWIIYGRRTLPTVPFSLELLPLEGTYANQQNPVTISPRDEEVILPFILGATGGYVGPSPTVAKKPVQQPVVTDYGLQVALLVTQARYPDRPVVVEPRRLAYDLVVGPADDPSRLVAVRTVREERPVFTLSEATRQLSIAHPDRFSLVVITGLRSDPASYQSVLWQDGRIADDRYNLQPATWAASLRG